MVNQWYQKMNQAERTVPVFDTASRF